MSEWGKLLRSCIFDYLKKHDDILEEPYLWAAHNLTVESDKNFKRRLFKPIGVMPAELIRHIQLTLNDPRIDAYVTAYFNLQR